MKYVFINTPLKKHTLETSRKSGKRIEQLTAQEGVHKSRGQNQDVKEGVNRLSFNSTIKKW